MKRFKAFFLFLLLLEPASRLAAAIWYVNAAATGANNGTSLANAWTSLSTAVGSASILPGDFVYIEPGTYGPGTFTIGISGNAGNPITFEKDPGAGPAPVIVGQTAGYGPEIFYMWAQNYVTLKNLTLEGCDATGVAIFNNCTGISVIDCIFQNFTANGAYGIDATTFGSAATLSQINISGNTFTNFNNSSGYPAKIIALEGNISNSQVTNNTINSSGAFYNGIDIDCAGSAPTHILVSGNSITGLTAEGGTSGCTVCYGAGIFLDGATYSTATANSLGCTNGWAIQVGYTVDGPGGAAGNYNLISNNIIWGSTQSAFNVGTFGAGTGSASYNSFLNNTLFENSTASSDGEIAIWSGDAPSTQNVFANNVVWPNTAAPSTNTYITEGTLTNAPTDTTFDYNDYWSNSLATGNFVSTNGTSYVTLANWKGSAGENPGAPDPHSFSSNPDFSTSPGSPCGGVAADFIPLCSSPLVNAGENEASVPLDFLGISRPASVHWTIGAYEIAPCGSTPTYTPTHSPSSTATPSPSSTWTETASPSASPTKSLTVSPTPSPSASPSSTLTSSVTQSMTSTGTGTATPSATPTLSLTQSPTRSATPSSSASATLTSSPTTSDTPSSTLTVTPTPSFTGTPSSSDTRTSSPSATASATPTQSLTPTPTSSATPSSSASATLTPSATTSNTASSTLTASPSPSFTATPSTSDTPTASPSASASASLTATYSSSPSASITPSFTNTSTSTPSMSITVTPSPTTSFTGTPSVTPSSTATSSLTASPSSTASATKSSTFTPTSSFSASPTFSPSPSVTQTPVPMPFQLTITIYNEAGEVVRTLFSGESEGEPNQVALSSGSLASGSSSVSVNLGASDSVNGQGGLVWDGGNNQGQSVSPGVYYIQVTFKDSFGRITSVTNPVQVLPGSSQSFVQIFNSAGELVYQEAVTDTAQAEAISGPNSFSPPSASSGGQELQLEIKNGEGNWVPWSWNGRNSQGQIVSSGNYSIMVSSVAPSGEVNVTKSITVIDGPVSFVDPAPEISVNPLTKGADLFIRYQVQSGNDAYGALFTLSGEKVKEVSDEGGTGTLDFGEPKAASGIYMIDFEYRQGSQLLERKILKLAIVK